MGKLYTFPDSPSRSVGREIVATLKDVETQTTDVAMDVVLEEIKKLNTQLDHAMWYAVTSLTRALRFREKAKNRIYRNKEQVRALV